MGVGLIVHNAPPALEGTNLSTTLVMLDGRMPISGGMTNMIATSAGSLPGRSA